MSKELLINNHYCRLSKMGPFLDEASVAVILSALNNKFPKPLNDIYAIESAEQLRNLVPYRAFVTTHDNNVFTRYMVRAIVDHHPSYVDIITGQIYSARKHVCMSSPRLCIKQSPVKRDKQEALEFVRAARAKSKENGVS